MSSRISTSMMHALAVAQMQSRQAALFKVQQQIATQSRLLTAKDDPVAAGVAVALDRAEAAWVRYGENASQLAHRLSLTETALSSIGDRIARLREIAIQANSGAMSAEDRRAFLPELREHYDALLALANTSDGQGRFLFGGAQDGAPPFVRVSGGVDYVGDQTQRRVEIAPEVSIADSDPGSEIFLRIRNGNGHSVARPDPGNAGVAVIKSDGITDPGAWDGGSYRVAFSGGAYTVLDSGGNPVATGPYVPGEAIRFAGYQLTLGGEPADGDAFDVGPARNQGLFETLENLIATIQMPGLPASNKAAQQNAFYAVLQDLEQAGNHVIDARASVGARLATLDRTAEEREGQLLATRVTLSSLRDLDYAEAITRLTRESTTLEAAQLSFARIQSLSLFSLLR
ncbi:flagellar hook-associated protein FlgL [Rehaibacterium terrae]|jgi:flagellar hook-associated protein 3 FlgL|uniref:Flagellar hook-associated protein 3 FlgL n=1 Tax=Rehaibacterium terrae TaxID=1341696 RepID=A0A7W7Y275_9GAMM|nr:flagellar hook-associated protein FlgL [Rehaibacterium terrae]MBB5016483.1 flagellar hook-associated protein 3 FlgL [Rehaibacterium terrae]